MALDKPDRTHRISVRLTDAELRILQDRMESTGLSASDIMRQAFRAHVGATPPNKPKH
jgi:hypothetical protein